MDNFEYRSNARINSRNEQLNNSLIERARRQQEIEMFEADKRKDFVKTLVEKCEKNGRENGYSKEKLKEEINKILITYLEKTGMNAVDMIFEFADIEPYEGFNIKDFMIYTYRNTADTAIIKDICSEFGQTAWNMAYSIQKLNDRIEWINETYINAAGIENLRKRYGLRSAAIAPVKGQILSEKELRDYCEVMETMKDRAHDVEELYRMAKEQINYFQGMGSLYEKTMFKICPELEEYIDSIIGNLCQEAVAEKENLIARRNKEREYQIDSVKNWKECDDRIPNDDLILIENKNNKIVAIDSKDVEEGKKYNSSTEPWRRKFLEELYREVILEEKENSDTQYDNEDYEMER